MAYAVDLNGVIKHATIAGVDGVMEEYEYDPENPNEPTLIGYLVAVPYRGGLHLPKFDMVQWADYVALRDAPPEYTTDPETGEQMLVPKVLPDPSDCWIEALTPEEIAERTAPQSLPPSEIDILGQQLVEKDIQILDLQQQNDTLGQQLVAIDLRLLALEGGGGA